MDGGGLRRLHDDDRIWLRRFDAPVELDAERAAGARDEEDVLPLARELDEAVGDGRLDALGVVRGAIASKTVRTPSLLESEVLVCLACLSR